MGKIDTTNECSQTCIMWSNQIQRIIRAQICNGQNGHYNTNECSQTCIIVQRMIHAQICNVHCK